MKIVELIRADHFADNVCLVFADKKTLKWFAVEGSRCDHYPSIASVIKASTIANEKKS